MKLVERITLVVKEIGKDIKGLKGRVLALESAPDPTVDEGMVTRKVNESVDSLKSQIPTLVAPTINVEIAKVVGGAPTAYDTLKEISDYIENDKSGAATIASSINNRLRIDEQQVLSEQQQSHVLGALGITDVDFVAIYNTAVNG